jgi:GNAT superfamily N-acetyltransferase
VSDLPERIELFDRELTERLSTRVERCRSGTAFFHDAFPRRWDSNFIWVRSTEDVGAAELAADAEEVLGGAGLEHRQIYETRIERANALAPAFAALGYEIDRDVTMVHVREPDRWTDGVAEEIDLPTARRFYLAANQAADDGAHAADAQMLADFCDVLVERVGARFFGVRAGSDVAAACHLYVVEAIAQVEDVFTLPAHRDRGHARAVVLAAVRAARGAGADLVHLYADDEDWPKQMYAKLGFDEVTRTAVFRKPPPDQRA